MSNVRANKLVVFLPHDLINFTESHSICSIITINNIYYYFFAFKFTLSELIRMLIK